MEKGYKEWDRHNPNNPYAAAKSAAEMACISYAHTYKMPIMITNCENIIGERQDRDKFVPLIINHLLSGKKLSIHATADRKQAGRRYYLHARNICSAVIWLLENGKLLDGTDKQGKYNLVGPDEIDNLQMAQLVSKLVNEWIVKNNNPESHKDPKVLNYEFVSFHASRPGHDLRYSLDGSHLIEEGFEYPVNFEDSLRRTIWWTLEHPMWL